MRSHLRFLFLGNVCRLRPSVLAHAGYQIERICVRRSTTGPQSSALARLEAAVDRQYGSVEKRTKDVSVDQLNSMEDVSVDQLNSAKDVSVDELLDSILNAPTGKDAAQTFLRSQEDLHPFHLKLLLRSHENIDSISFRRLLVYVWCNPPVPLLNHLDPERSGQSISVKQFVSLVSALLYWARKVSSHDVVSIARIVVTYGEKLAAILRSEDGSLNSVYHARLSNLYNKILQRLQYPSSIKPYKSMEYNWTAQQIILRAASELSPPVQISHGTYRAVATVILCLRKSPQEEKYSGLLESSWPPWRIEQHGIDATRPADDDLSRVSSILIRMAEGGFKSTTSDEAIKIYGGRESDGTPTIHTRSYLKTRNTTKSTARPMMKGQSAEESVIDSTKDDTPEIWAARITATRTIQEAWAAFVSLGKERQSHKMYFAMIRKLVYNARLTGGMSQATQLPGDSNLDLFPIVADNLSIDRKAQLTPPSLTEFYDMMIESGIRPQGRCLAFLIRHSRKASETSRYLRDAGMEEIFETSVRLVPWKPVGNFDTIKTQSEIAGKLLANIPDFTFSALIAFLCRSGIPRDGRNGMERTHYLNQDPFRAAFKLLKARRPLYRGAWNAFFCGLARENAYLTRYDYYLDPTSFWYFLKWAHGESRKLGLELDHHGFHYIVRGFEKALLLCRQYPLDIRLKPLGLRWMKEGYQLLKDEFAKLGRLEPHLDKPRLVFELSAVELHSYIRVVGIVGDIEEMKFISGWMLDHQDHLTALANQSKFGRDSLRRAVIAIGTFTGSSPQSRTEAAYDIRNFIDQIEEWGGWPSNEEIWEYWKRWHDLEVWKTDRRYYLPRPQLEAYLAKKVEEMEAIIDGVSLKAAPRSLDRGFTDEDDGDEFGSKDDNVNPVYHMVTERLREEREGF